MGKISLSMAQSTKTWLKGSDIPHRNIVHIDLEADDGIVARIYLSVDQFVRLLIGNSQVDCTLSHYRSGNQFSSEEVEPPKTVGQRMVERLGETEGNFHNRLKELQKTVKDIKDGHVKPNKKVIDEVLREIDVLISHHMSNREFVASCAQEELEHLTEIAAAQLAGKIGADQEQVSLLLGGMKQKALPAMASELAPPKGQHERDSRAIKDMGPLQLAETINKFLKKLEATQSKPKDGEYAVKLYCSGAQLTGNNKITITYVSYQGHTAIDLEEAREWAEYLAAGGRKRHFDYKR
jgi:hypothetical protein